MQLLYLLTDLTVEDGVRVILDAVAFWADSLVDRRGTYISESVRQFAMKVTPSRNHDLLSTYTAADYWTFLVVEFGRRMRNRLIKEKRQRLNSAPQPLSQTELQDRARVMAESMRGLTIEQALDQFEETVVHWATIYNVNMPYTVHEKREDLTDEKDSYYILKLLADLTER